MEGSVLQLALWVFLLCPPGRKQAIPQMLMREDREWADRLFRIDEWVVKSLCILTWRAFWTWQEVGVDEGELRGMCVSHTHGVCLGWKSVCVYLGVQLSEVSAHTQEHTFVVRLVHAWAFLPFRPDRKQPTTGVCEGGWKRKCHTLMEYVYDNRMQSVYMQLSGYSYLVDLIGSTQATTRICEGEWKRIVSHTHRVCL